MKKPDKVRTERDSMGEKELPADVYWGIQTQRAIENFPVSGIPFPSEFISSLGLIKKMAAKTNQELNLLDSKLADPIARAADEVMVGRWHDQFPVDIFQTGSGTSTHMNVNEVIAHRANEMLGFPLGSKTPVHPNDHVNLGQSSNDVIPTCIHITINQVINKELLPQLIEFKTHLQMKMHEFDRILKLGRTHLQDATPVRLGQEFGGFAAMIDQNHQRLERANRDLLELTLGGTAVGTGINCHPQFAAATIDKINLHLDTNFKKSKNHFADQGSKDSLVQVSATLKTLAVSLTKIINDIRWMGSGPNGGIAELKLPALQPGSSIMPGKVNPVIAESLLQVAAQVMGNDTTVTIAGQSGNFELNVMMPVMAYNIFLSCRLLTNGIHLFTEKCITGLTADKNRSLELLQKSPALVTALTPRIGYERAAEIARESIEKGRPIMDVIRQKSGLSEDEIRTLLDPHKMTVTT